jgi:hypothetical protein
MIRTELESCVYFHLKDYKKPKLRKKKIINKIVTLDFFVKNELTNIEKIKTIPHYKKYYYICENSSELLITEIDENVNYFKSNKNTSVDNSILFKYEDTELIYLKNHLKASLSSPKIYILNLINSFQQLLKSIYLLNDNQLVHNFINFETVVINPNDSVLLTNFAFSLDVSLKTDFKQFFIEYDPSYIEWPPELHILSFLQTNKMNSLSSYNIENIINNLVDNHSILKTFDNKIITTYKSEAIDYFKKYVNCSYDDILKDILQFYKTWDNYALSIMYLRILIDLHRKIQKKNKFIILFMKLLVCNINLNPFSRFNIISTLNKFASILDSLEPKDYKEVIDNLMSSSTSTSTSTS